jgi:Flp pilus assembly pilin Flp
MKVRNTLRQSARHLCRKAYDLGSALWYDDSGAVATEYVILTGLFAVALTGAAAELAHAVRIWFWRKALAIAEHNLDSR